jgi:hypothetical protein
LKPLKNAEERTGHCHQIIFKVLKSLRHISVRTSDSNFMPHKKIGSFLSPNLRLLFFFIKMYFFWSVTPYNLVVSQFV